MREMKAVRRRASSQNVVKLSKFRENLPYEIGKDCVQFITPSSMQVFFSVLFNKLNS